MLFLAACAPPTDDLAVHADSGVEGDSAADSGDSAADSGGADSGGPGPAVEALTAAVDDDITALVWASWTQNEPAVVTVEYRFEGDAWLSTPPRTVEPGPQRQLVAGAPYGSTLELRVASDGADPEVSDAVTIANGVVPRAVPVATVLASEPTAWDPAMPYVLLSLAGSFGSWNIIVDRAGRVVWAVETTDSRVSIHTRVSYDGHDILLDENSFWGLFDGGISAEVYRMKLDGTVVEALDVPGCHHPFVELPDHSILYASLGTTLGERLIRRWPDGTFTEVWDCQPFANAHGEREVCGSNTLWYDELTDTVYDSVYTLETIVEVGVTSGEEVRWFGHLADAWAFDPPESAFWWQHGVNLTADGTLLTSSMGVDRSEETVVREYAFDDAGATLEEVWSFGDGEGIFGDVMGEAHRLGNGDTLHNLGSAIRIREVTPDRRVVWDIAWEASTMGRSTPIPDLYAFVD